jgi:PAS domain S-box-containing protein
MEDLVLPLSGLSAFALDQVPDSVIITDANLTRPGGPLIIYVNQAMLDLTGYSREELFGKSPKIFQGEDTNRETASRIIEQLRSGQKVSETILNYTKDGTTYWTEINITPVRDDHENVIAYLSIQHDLSHFQKVKQQHERDLRLASTGEKIARVGTWGYDLEDHKVFWSDGTYDIWEWDRSEPLPSVSDCLEFIDKADQPMMAAMMDACIKTQTPYQTEVRAHSSKGMAMRLRVLGEAMLGEHGRTVAVFGAIRDITQEKRLEAELDETISQISETEQYFSIARTIAKIGVFDYWIDHDRLHWSDELCEMTGLSPSLFPSKAEVFLSGIDAKDLPEYQRLMDAAISNHQGYSITLRFNRPDGKTMHMAIIAEVRDSPYGARVVGIARDVTSDVEASLRLSREQERFRIIADCVSDVLWDYDFNEKSLWVTPNWPRKLGVDLDGSGTDPTQWLEYVAPDDREHLVRSINQALSSGDGRWKCEFKQRVSAYFVPVISTHSAVTCGQYLRGRERLEIGAQKGARRVVSGTLGNPRSAEKAQNRAHFWDNLGKKNPCKTRDYCLVRSRRLELPRAFAHNDLNVARLPIPPRPHSGFSGQPDAGPAVGAGP